MGDLIFVPELGLITGKNHNLSFPIWYPSTSSYRPLLKKPKKLNKKQKASPFNQTQHIMPLRLRTHNLKKQDLKMPQTALEVNIQPRPLTIETSRHIKNKNYTGVMVDNTKNSFLSTSLEVRLQARPLTIVGGKRVKLSLDNRPNNDISGEVYVNLPSLHQRPYKMDYNFA
ncbi:hypothetical protein SteCoe_11563 [Stentor coeruleus]|uniref:Uncharacterized protein n=1 Tax=Stentor coeruleus TaxID=5963 RepID=A0A1R2CCV2_9CILI|nr:hypothetical protein SteCoe_11563 [Stentor coeruleus]